MTYTRSRHSINPIKGNGLFLILINGMGSFPVSWLFGGIGHFYSNFNISYCGHSAASDLVHLCLHMNHKRMLGINRLALQKSFAIARVCRVCPCIMRTKCFSFFHAKKEYYGRYISISRDGSTVLECILAHWKSLSCWWEKKASSDLQGMALLLLTKLLLIDSKVPALAILPQLIYPFLHESSCWTPSTINNYINKFSCLYIKKNTCHLH